jgi:hypothetical protein
MPDATDRPDDPTQADHPGSSGLPDAPLARPGTQSHPGEVAPSGSRRLERPPSERYVKAGRAADDEATRGSVARAIGFAIVPSVIGVALFLVLAGPLAADTGLVLVAGAMGLAIGSAVARGGRALPTGQRVPLAAVIFVVALAAGEIFTWQFALSEGGVLELAPYLWQTFGGLVVLQLLAGLVGSAITAA